MFNLLAYGSLLNPVELSKYGFNTTDATLVVVHGFRRSFNQEPSWRNCKSCERAVLNVEEYSEASFNAILVTGFDDGELVSLDERERGYTRKSVELSRMSPFLNADFCLPTCDTYLYCGKAEKRNESILPNNSYLELCMRGAMYWGQAFQDAFLSSTFVAGRSVHGFLANYPRRS